MKKERTGKRYAKCAVSVMLAVIMTVCCCAFFACGGGGDDPEPVVALESIEITKAPDKTQYIAGEEFDKTGMQVTAKYTDGSSKRVTKYKYEPSEALTREDTVVTVSYTEDDVTKTAEQAISVIEAGVPDAGSKRLSTFEAEYVTTYWKGSTAYAGGADVEYNLSFSDGYALAGRAVYGGTSVEFFVKSPSALDADLYVRIKAAAAGYDLAHASDVFEKIEVNGTEMTGLSTVATAVTESIDYYKIGTISLKEGKNSIKYSMPSGWGNANRIDFDCMYLIADEKVDYYETDVTSSVADGTVYKFEAEDAVLANCLPGYDGTNKEEGVPTSVGTLTNGNGVVTFNINSPKETKAHMHIETVMVSGKWQDIYTIWRIKVNGETYDLHRFMKNDEYVGSDWKNQKDVDAGDIDLIEGKNTIEFSLRNGMSTTNFDFITLETNDCELDWYVEKPYDPNTPGTFGFEAENAVLLYGNGSANPAGMGIKRDDFSNGIALAGRSVQAGKQVEFFIDSYGAQNADLTVHMAAAAGKAFATAADIFESITVNGTSVESLENIDMALTETCAAYTVGEIALIEGKNVVLFTMKNSLENGSLYFDKIVFDTKVSEVKWYETKTTTIEDGKEHTFTGSDAVLNGCQLSGTIVGSLTASGKSITFNLHVDATEGSDVAAHFTMRLANVLGSDTDIYQVFKIELDGVELDIHSKMGGSDFNTDLLWNNYVEIDLGDIILKGGYNTLTLTLRDANSVTNFGWIKLETEEADITIGTPPVGGDE